MRTLLVYAISLLTFLFSASLLYANGDQSGPGNGTDYVKVLFAEAQYDVVRALTPLNDASLAGLGLPAETLNWLTGKSQGDTRFARIKYWLRRMDLRFQDGPCGDGSGKEATICYFFTPTNDPYVVISVNLNRMTTKDQAMAMLIHEAGHFAGEPDHLLLDRVGVSLVAATKVPSSLFADASSTEVSVNPFQGKADCDAGQGDQAKNLRNQAKFNLLAQCTQRDLTCDPAKIQFAYQGTNEYEDGSGFQMKVTCLVRAILPLH
jgi:hypothetical protein